MQALPQEKREFINTFLSEPLIARMATADKSGQPHVRLRIKNLICADLHTLKK
jgi:hypothetical protein